MKVLGIIAEYNPIHNGHLYHLAKSKEMTQADYTILVMSGSFTQVGNIAVLDKFQRARLAILHGVDLVLELPTIYSTASAEYFAQGAISLLDKLAIVDTFSFGSECDSLATLKYIATSMIDNQQHIWKEVAKQEKQQSIAKSRALVLKQFLTQEQYAQIDQSNNILGIEYLKQCMLTNSTMIPNSVPRVTSDFNNSSNTPGFISSTSIRNKLKTGDINGLENYVPPAVLSALSKNKLLFNQSFFALLQYKITSMTCEELFAINGMVEGLEHRIKTASTKATNYQELLIAIKSKRYTETKIKRTLVNILLSITKEQFMNATKNNLNYAHVLALSEAGKTLLSSITKHASITLYSSLTDDLLKKEKEEISSLLQLDITASNIHSILTQTSQNKDYTNRL